MSAFRFVVDNSGENTIASILQHNIRPGAECSFAIAYFTLSGFQLVADPLEQCKTFRLLLGSEPGSDPLRMTIMDIWRNIDLRGSTKQAERAVNFFSRKTVEVRLHQGPFYHGKTYILNHPIPNFVPVQGTKLHPKEFSVETSATLGTRPRSSSLAFKEVAQEGLENALSIVGSSNFTYPGLLRNTELNLLDSKGETVLELMTWFEEHWVASRDIKDDFIKLLRGYYRPFDPFWIYAKALWDLYREDLEPPETGKPGSTIELAEFQKSGSQAARRILQRWGGVLIADAPGLGKTFIAGQLLEDYAYHLREPALIICPAEVEQIWDSFTKKYRITAPAILHTEILGRGMREGAPEESITKYKNYSFILVDESHHFRNPMAGRYAWLQQLLALPKPEIKREGKLTQVNRKVVFVTATPVNNSVWDLYAQLLLLFGERLKEIAARQGIADIFEYFEEAQEAKGNLYDLIEAVAVRRSRTFIREYYPNATLEGVPIRFPERELERIEYSMHSKLGDLHTLSARIIETCHLVPYRIESYRLDSGDETKIKRGDLLSTLFRVLILKRLESSLPAFQKTLLKIIDLLKSSLAQLEKGMVFSAANLREYLELLQSTGEDDRAFDTGISELIEAGNFDVETMKRDLTYDLSSLDRIVRLLPDPPQIDTVDTKLAEVRTHLTNSKHKILIFTSFVDTAEYLYKHLQGTKVVVGLVTSEKSQIWNGETQEGVNRAKIINLFSPKSNEYTLRPGEREIQILVASDVLSEALNLQDAAAVLNYDFPWNPMKLVQRAGRIDRIRSLHKKITIYNVFPDKGLDTILHLMEKLFNKIAQTHRAVGLEWSLIGEEPIPVDFAEAYEKIKAGDKRILVDIEKKMEGLVGLDPQEQLLAILQTLSKEELERIPDGAGSLTTLPSESKNRMRGLFVAYRRRRSPGDADRIWRFYPDMRNQTISSKTEIVQQIQFPLSHHSETRFGEESLQKLRDARTALEEELRTIEAQQRTIRITGPLRRAFDLARRTGRAGIDKFLQANWQKPAVQREIRKIDFKNAETAIARLESLSKIYGISESLALPEQPEKAAQEKEELSDPALFELSPIPEKHDGSLELVAWMHIT